MKKLFLLVLSCSLMGCAIQDPEVTDLKSPCVFEDHYALNGNVIRQQTKVPCFGHAPEENNFYANMVRLV